MRPVALLCLLAVAATACQSRGGKSEAPVVLWHAYNGDEERALREVVELAGKQGIDIRAVRVPYDSFADKLSNAIPNGNGPDIFIFAHDRLGDWARAELLEPLSFYVTPELADLYDADVLKAMVHEQSLYGLPLAAKTIALYYRTDLIDSPPATVEELLTLCRKERSAGRYALAYDNVDLYFHSGWLHGFRGAVFTDDGELALDSPAGVAAAEFASELARVERCVPPDIDATLVTTLFNEGRTALAISGPWFAGDLGDEVPWAIAPLPAIAADQPSRPFLGVEGLWMSSRAESADRAFAAMRFLASNHSAEHRGKVARQIVPNHAAYAGDVGKDPLLRQFRDQLRGSVPMPATSEMRMVWQPYRQALQQIVNQGADASDALAAAQREVEGYIEGAQ